MKKNCRSNRGARNAARVARISLCRHPAAPLSCCPISPPEIPRQVRFLPPAHGRLRLCGCQIINFLGISERRAAYRPAGICAEPAGGTILLITGLWAPERFLGPMFGLVQSCLNLWYTVHQVKRLRCPRGLSNTRAIAITPRANQAPTGMLAYA